jgi:predicted LPLAT superfamily acyltransferase
MALTRQVFASTRNPGPSRGLQFLRLADLALPEPVFRPLRAAGTWVALASMSQQRRASWDYLPAALGREPRLLDQFRHFFSLCESLMLKLRVANGTAHRLVLGPDSGDFGRWLKSGGPAFLGTLHVGNSDLTGFLLALQDRRRVHIVRHRVGNSEDTEALARRLGGLVRFIWVNDPGDLLFALKEACASGEAVALQCDRAEHSSRTETFDFLGAKRTFPITIYHLAFIFNRPVFLSVGVPGGPDVSVVHASPAFEPLAGEPRAAGLERARAHFQAFLARVESYLRAHPYDWFNFRPL